MKARSDWLLTLRISFSREWRPKTMYSNRCRNKRVLKKSSFLCYISSLHELIKLWPIKETLRSQGRENKCLNPLRHLFISQARQSKAKNAIRAGMRDWSTRTCISFRRQRKSDKSYVNFTLGLPCYHNIKWPFFYIAVHPKIMFQYIQYTKWAQRNFLSFSRMIHDKKLGCLLLETTALERECKKS